MSPVLDRVSGGAARDGGAGDRPGLRGVRHEPLVVGEKLLALEYDPNRESDERGCARRYRDVDQQQLAGGDTRDENADGGRHQHGAEPDHPLSPLYPDAPGAA
jgi:hypothetical protein